MWSKRDEDGSAGIINYCVENSIVKDPFVAHAFAQCHRWADFKVSAYRAYCVIAGWTSHDCLNPITSHPPFHLFEFILSKSWLGESN